MTEKSAVTGNESQSPRRSALLGWLSVGGAFAGGLAVYTLVVPLFASAILEVISPLCETVGALRILGAVISWGLPGLVMLGVGLGVGFLFWQIPLRVGLAAGIGAATSGLLAVFSLPVMAVNEPRVIGEAIVVMIAGLIGGALARKLDTREKGNEAPHPADRPPNEAGK